MSFLKVPKNVRQIIVQMLSENKTQQEIATHCGVSRQRIQQLISNYNIVTRPHTQNGYWKQQSIEKRWLWKMLSHRLTKKQGRWEIYQELASTLPKKCPILGFPLRYGPSPTGFRTDFSPSIDRINSDKGYESGNLHIISWRANRIKNDGNVHEIIKIGEYLKNLLDKPQIS